MCTYVKHARMHEFTAHDALSQSITWSGLCLKRCFSADCCHLQFNIFQMMLL